MFSCVKGADMSSQVVSPQLCPFKFPCNREHKCKRSSPSELSIGCIITHLPSSFSAPSPSLLFCPSPPSAPFYAQNKSERTHGCRRKQERQQAVLRVIMVFGFLPQATCSALCEVQVDNLRSRLFIYQSKVSPGFNVANRDFRRSVFHLKVGLRNSRTGCH